MSAMADKPLDLRSRTRENVRVQIAEVAFNVFAERGFDAVTATEVAEAAGISRASFFRYFESKEDAVFVAQEEVGAKIAARLRERPAGEDAWSALRQSLDPIIAVYRESPTQSLARLRLTRSTTKLRAHQLERFDQWKQLIGAALAERLGVEEVDLRIEALVAAALAALGSASSRWAASDGADDLIELIDEAFGAIAGPFPELRG
jgi:AcrR family transcriptional regulator